MGKIEVGKSFESRIEPCPPTTRIGDVTVDLDLPTAKTQLESDLGLTRAEDAESLDDRMVGAINPDPSMPTRNCQSTQSTNFVYE